MSRRHRALEAELVTVLVEIDEAKLFRNLGWSSLFSYAVSALGLSEATAYAFITVARKTKQVEDLGNAIESRRISVSKAGRLVGILTRENARRSGAHKKLCANRVAGEVQDRVTIRATRAGIWHVTISGASGINLPSVQVGRHLRH